MGIRILKRLQPGRCCTSTQPSPEKGCRLHMSSTEANTTSNFGLDVLDCHCLLRVYSTAAQLVKTQDDSLRLQPSTSGDMCAAAPLLPPSIPFVLLSTPLCPATQCCCCQLLDGPQLRCYLLPVLPWHALHATSGSIDSERAAICRTNIQAGQHNSPHNPLTTSIGLPL